MTTVRLTGLHFRSRSVVRELIWLAAIAAIAWLTLRGDEAPATRPMLLLFAPLLAAAAVGAAAYSPFGETEETVGAHLIQLRATHLLGLVALGALLFVVVDAAGGIGWALARNLAGYAGLALLGARFLGANWFWVPPTLFAAFVGSTCLAAVTPNPWAMWPVAPTASGIALMVAVGLFLVGLILVAWHGAKTTVGDGVATSV
jgi:hypothetical protein